MDQKRSTQHWHILRLYLHTSKDCQTRTRTKTRMMAETATRSLRSGKTRTRRMGKTSIRRVIILGNAFVWIYDVRQMISLHHSRETN